MVDRTRKKSEHNSAMINVKLDRSTASWFDELSRKNEVRKSKLCEIIIESEIEEAMKSK